MRCQCCMQCDAIGAAMPHVQRATERDLVLQQRAAPGPDLPPLWPCTQGAAFNARRHAGAPQHACRHAHTRSRLHARARSAQVRHSDRSISSSALSATTAACRLVARAAFRRPARLGAASSSESEGGEAASPSDSLLAAARRRRAGLAAPLRARPAAAGLRPRFCSTSRD